MKHMDVVVEFFSDGARRPFAFATKQRWPPPRGAKCRHAMRTSSACNPPRPCSGWQHARLFSVPIGDDVLLRRLLHCRANKAASREKRKDSPREKLKQRQRELADEKVRIKRARGSPHELSLGTATTKRRRSLGVVS